MSPYERDFWKDPLNGYYKDANVCHNKQIRWLRMCIRLESELPLETRLRE